MGLGLGSSLKDTTWVLCQQVPSRLSLRARDFCLGLSMPFSPLGEGGSSVCAVTMGSEGSCSGICYTNLVPSFLATALPLQSPSWFLLPMRKLLLRMKAPQSSRTVRPARSPLPSIAQQAKPQYAGSKGLSFGRVEPGSFHGSQEQNVRLRPNRVCQLSV